MHSLKFAAHSLHRVSLHRSFTDSAPVLEISEPKAPILFGDGNAAESDLTQRLEIVGPKALGLVVFWSQFADWGMGDSVYPYACANASAPGQVIQCHFNMSVFEIFFERKASTL